MISIECDFCSKSKRRRQVRLNNTSWNHSPDLFAVEADGGSGVDVLIELEPVQDGGLAGRVQTYHGAVVGDEAGHVVRQGHQQGGRAADEVLPACHPSHGLFRPHNVGSASPKLIYMLKYDVHYVQGVVYLRYMQVYGIQEAP